MKEPSLKPNLNPTVSTPWPLPLTRKAVAALIDQTLLRPDATEAEIDRLCSDAVDSQFVSVCVNPVYVERIRRRLEGTGVRAGTVVGFPLGATLPSIKAREARDAQERGAEELDVVLQIGLLKSGCPSLVKEELELVVAERRSGTVLKVILETVLLNDAEKRAACRIALDVGADFVKTSTGFAVGGSTVTDVALLRKAVGSTMGVKASGGIRNLETLLSMVVAGASRIGTSAGPSILKELPQ